MSFVQVSEIEEKLETIKLQASRRGRRRKPGEEETITKTVLNVNKNSVHKDNAVVPKEFNSIAEFYANAITKDKPPYVIKPGTPISDGEANDFPSPRLGLEEGKFYLN